MNQPNPETKNLILSNLKITNIEKHIICNTDLPIIGNSQSFNKIKKQIEYASQVDLPIYIIGETGTETSAIAKFLHKKKSYKKGRYINIPATDSNLEEYKNFIDQEIERSKNGTIYISNIDTLCENKRSYLAFLLSNENIYQRLDKLNIQLIISTTKPYSLTESPISQAINTCTTPIEIKIPPLRDRKEDIPIYIHYFLESLGGQPEQKVSDEAVNIMSLYTWPENISQLKNTMMALISSQVATIKESDLRALGIKAPKEASYNLINSILEGNTNHYQHLHPALAKAMKYINQNFRNEITLQDVADSAFTSTSHLSYLFRKKLNLSFKSVLIQIRIQYAKNLLTEKPITKITEACLQSGFGDLSHFEKMFKRYSACTPREYRQKQRLTCSETVT